MSYEVKDGYVLIPKKEYEEMEEKIEFLCALQGAGVDNWDGYDSALEVMYPDE